MKHWFADQAFRAIVRNASYLGSSKIFAALLDLLALGLAGRALAPVAFGVLAIVLAYAQGISDLVKFQTWQFVVRFGTPALAGGDVQKFRDVTGFSFGLDLASAAVALVAGVALLPFLGRAVGIGPADMDLALFYCTLIPVMTAATPTGILRTFDRFDLLAVQQLITPVLRAAGAAVTYFAGWGFAGFIVTWYVARFVGDLAIWFIAVRELQLRRIRGALRPGLVRLARRIRGAWDFVWTTNFGHSIYSVWGPGSNVVVGVVLGPAAAGLFKIAFTFFDAAGKPAGLMGKSFFPEIMRLDPSSKRPWQLGVRSGAMAAGMGILLALVLVFGGRPLILAVFGPGYLDAYVLLEIMVAALIVSMASFPLESLLYMANRQRAALVAQALAAVLYGLLLVALTWQLGLVGAAIAYVGGQCMKAAFWLVPTWSAYRGRATLTAHLSSEAEH